MNGFPHEGSKDLAAKGPGALTLSADPTCALVRVDTPAEDNLEESSTFA
jgi:hypothetical protein